VKRAAAGLFFLRPSIVGSLKRSLQGKAIFQEILDFYGNAKRLAIRAEDSTVMALPQRARETIFNRVGQTARETEIEIPACACNDPDLAKGTCGIGGVWPQRFREGAQPRLIA
jgi:hypothetical protein